MKQEVKACWLSMLVLHLAERAAGMCCLVAEKYPCEKHQNELLLQEETEKSTDWKARFAEMVTTEKVVWDMKVVN
jgi:hypothetical protein